MTDSLEYLNPDLMFDVNPCQIPPPLVSRKWRYSDIAKCVDILFECLVCGKKWGQRVVFENVVECPFCHPDPEDE